MRKSLVAGNWKMNGDRAVLAKLLDGIKAGAAEVAIELAVFPPYLYLPMTAEKLAGTGIRFGTQNMSQHGNGAYTGEVSASMLQDFNCHYVILGHSERRQLFHEGSSEVAEKCKTALSAGIIPILCVGETLEERKAEKTLSVVQEQLAAILRMKDNLPALSDMVIAYEPIWAIGTGETATPEQAQEVHAAIREQLREALGASADSIRILYGGSVKPANANALFAMPDIDGGLVGGASLNADDFLEISRQCNK